MQARTVEGECPPGFDTPGIVRVALGWAKHGAGVVPMRSSLVENGHGKLSPVPLIKWQQEGPLRDRESILRFWQDVPEAQLAILLENGLAAVDVDTKHLSGGVAPPGHPLPHGGGYQETTKSGGFHYVFGVKEEQDPLSPTRVTGLGGYVDVFTGGLLVVAPSRFYNAEQGYVLLCKDIMVFPTMAQALGTYASWLPGAWRTRMEAATGIRPLPTDERKERPATPANPVNLTEVADVLQFIRKHPRAATVFGSGLRHPDGTIDRSMTEFRLVSILKQEGFSRETCWDIVRLCPHTKSPQDMRGWQRFERHVWSRLP